MALWLLLLLPAADEDGYTYPPEQRGATVARLTVSVPQGTGPARVDYTLTVEGGPVLEVDPAQLSDPTSAWTARRLSAWTIAGQRVTWSETIELEQSKPGLPPLPDVTLTVRDGANAPPEVIEWKDILSDIRELPGPDADSSPGRTAARARWVALAAAAGVIALVGAWLVRRRRRREPPLSPYRRALRDLDRLEAAATTAEASPERQFTRLADVVRQFLTDEFGLPAFQQTTAEFLRTVRAAPALTAEADALGAILDGCDLAKFAPVEDNREQWQQVVGRVRSFLHGTGPHKPVVTPAPSLATRGPGEAANDLSDGTN